MRYPIDILHRADQTLSDRRVASGLDLDQRKKVIREQHPEIWIIHLETMQAGAQIGKARIMGNQEQYDALYGQMMHCRSRVCESLVAAGLPENYLDSWHHCYTCKDQGYVAGGVCECRRQLLNQLTYDALSNVSRVEECSFATFRLDYYEGKSAVDIRRLLVSCKRYADCFSRKSPSLLFRGPPGLGKTHLSLAIAGEVVHKGNLVLYASAPQLLERLVDINLTRDPQVEYRDIAYGCDLLVLDDIGTEFQTQATKSEVYNLVNTRLIEGRPTIINTNLSLTEIGRIYDDRVRSRLENDYRDNAFSGQDIRYQKRINHENGRKSYG